MSNSLLYGYAIIYLSGFFYIKVLQFRIYILETMTFALLCYTCGYVKLLGKKDFEDILLINWP